MTEHHPDYQALSTAPVPLPDSNKGTTVDTDGPSLPGLVCTLQRDDLLSALTLISRATSGESAISPTPVLIFGSPASVRVQTEYSQGTLALTVPASVEASGTLLLPTNTLFDVIRFLSQGAPVTLAGVAGECLFTCGSRRVHLSCGSMDEAPVSGSSPLPELALVWSTLLCEAIREVFFAISAGTSRPRCLGLHVTDDTLHLVALDAFRLAHRQVPLQRSVPGRDARLLIPASFMHMLSDALAPSADEVVITATETDVCFTAGPLCLSTALVQGRFPAYTRLLERAETTTTFTLERFALLGLLYDLLPFACKDSRSLKLSWRTSAGLVFFQVGNEAGSAFDEMSAVVTGEEGEIFLSARYLCDVLEAVEAKTFTFSLSGPTAPVLLVPDSRTDYQSVLMPIMGPAVERKSDLS